MAVRKPRKPVFVCVLIIVTFWQPSCALHSSTDRQPRSAISDQPARPTIPEDIRININTATADELSRLPGLGPGLAARVVAHRDKYGPFRRVEHLMLVEGISENRFKRIRDLVRTE